MPAPFYYVLFYYGTKRTALTDFPSITTVLLFLIPIVASSF